MVGTLIRMSLAAQRMPLQGQRLFWMVVGFLLALGTIALGIANLTSLPISADLLALAFAAWTIFFALAPVFGNGFGLRAEHLVLLPISPGKLAAELLVTAAVTPSSALALLAFSALGVRGFQLGIVPGIVTLFVIPLQFIFVLLLARIVYQATGVAMQSRLGMELVALLLAVFLAAVSVGWFVLQPLIEQTGHLLSEGLPPALSTILRISPSGWGLVAVDAAGRSEGAVATGILLSFVLLNGALFWLWRALLTRSTSDNPARRIGRGGFAARLASGYFGAARTPMGAVISKELVTWIRDPWRAFAFRVALWTGLFMGGMPLLIGSRALLPFVGIAMILMAGIMAGNLYALDGTALWQTLVTPNAERLDVRGRQGAWLLIFLPVSLVTSIICVVLSGQVWAWSLVLAVLPAAIGVNAGLVPLVSVLFLSPGIDPQYRRNPMDSSGGEIGALFLLPIVTVIAAAPAAALAIMGLETDRSVLEWVGVFVGIVVGAFAAWGLGWFAYRKLQSDGSELLNRLRTGSLRTSKAEVDAETTPKLPLHLRLIVWVCACLFWLPLFPQGIVPLVFKLAHVEARSWFLPLYLPEALQFPTMIVMIGLGAAMLYVIIQIPRKYRREQTILSEHAKDRQR